jgi:glycosyltransferase involved in cell wall biosynthesis
MGDQDALIGPLVTVIIPTTCSRTRGELLRRAVKSVKAQTGVLVKLLVVVNGDSYDTNYLAELCSNREVTVHYLPTPSQAAAQRLGRLLVETPFFGYLDDDDEYLPDALSTRLAPMLSDPEVSVVATNGYMRTGGRDRRIHAVGRFDHGDFLRAIAKGHNWLPNGGAGLFRTKAIPVGYFDGTTRYLEWTILAYKLALDGKKVVYLDDVTFRIHDTPGSLSKSPEYRQAHLTLVPCMLSLNPPKRVVRDLRRLEARLLHDECAAYRVAGNFAMSWSLHLRSLRSVHGLSFIPYTLLLVFRIRLNRTTKTRAKPAVVLLGARFFCERLRPLLQRTPYPTAWSFGVGRRYLRFLLKPQYQILYFIGAPALSGKLLLLCRLLRKRIVIHWIGSDVLRDEVVESYTGASTKQLVAHWADAPWLAERLHSKGIHATHVPLFYIDDEALPFPGGRFTILFYLPNDRFDFYGGREAIKIAQQFPALKVLVVANAGSVEAPSNVEFLGWQTDMAAVYRRIHCLVRVPAHDGMSFMVLEALRHGRYVIWNHSVPGVLYASDTAGISRHLAQLYNAYNAGRLSCNLVGQEFVIKAYSADRVAERFDAALTGFLTENRSKETLKDAKRR